ncbi:MAG: response regulator [Pseudomonadota bacterium]
MTSDALHPAVAVDSDNLAVRIAPHLPLLRRYARALCGSQAAGDACVAATLETLIADGTAIDRALPARVGLYAVFQRVWSGAQGAPQGGWGRPTPASRQLLLLTTVEDFSLEQAAMVLGMEVAEARRLGEIARRELDRQRRAQVMIIEDEPIIALDLESIVDGMGHGVVGIAETHARAVMLARSTRPDVILADIQLADGSSGVEAVREILSSMTVPVIFITAFPERLLTGDRTEPTFLITKPFRPETVEAAIAQALFHAA